MEKGRDKEKLTELAENIAAIMQNPLTPVTLYNVLADIMTDWWKSPNLEDAGAILLLLRGQT
jgi:hypothetical protein